MTDTLQSEPAKDRREQRAGEWLLLLREQDVSEDTVARWIEWCHGDDKNLRAFEDTGILNFAGIGAIVGHLVHQGLPAGGIQALLGGDFGGMALGADPHHHVTAGTGRQGLVIVLGPGSRGDKARNGRQQNSNQKLAHDQLSLFAPNLL